MHGMGKSTWMVYVVIIAAMILKSVPTDGRYVEWKEVCCEKGGSSVDIVKADVYETERAYIIDVQVPGINVVNIEIKKKEREVWVRSEPIKPEDINYDYPVHVDPVRKHPIVVERGDVQFWRRFRFPISALMDRVEFRLLDGVLHVEAPLRR